MMRTTKTRFICTLVMIMVLSSMSLVYADSREDCDVEGKIFHPTFSNVIAITYDLTFNGSTAKQTVEVEPVSRTALDYITVDAELLRNGTVVKTWSQRVDKEDVTIVGSFRAYKEQTVFGSGTYQMHAITKCYKNGVVVDQVDEYSGKVVR